MAQLRVEKLLETLSDEGLSRLSEKIASKKRDSLSRLYHLVREEVASGGKLEEKKVWIFKRIFGKAYTKDLDYLLRNEYRLLTNAIYDVMAELEVLTNITRDEVLYERALFRALHKAKLWTELESSYQKFSEKARAACDYDALYEYNTLYASSLAEKHDNSPDALRQAHRLFEECASLCEQSASMKRAKSLYSAVAAEDMIQIRSSQPLKPALLDESPRNPLAKFYYHKAQSIRLTGAARIAKMEQALKELNHVKIVSVLMKKERLSALAHLGMLHFINSSFEDAVSRIGEAIALSREYGIALHASHYINHLSALIHKGDYEIAVEACEQYEPFLKVQFHQERLVMKAYAYLFLNEPLRAAELLPTSSSDCREDTLHLCRYAASIIHYQRGRIEDAHREAKNFHKRFQRAKNLELPEEKKFVKLFVDFFESEMLPDGKRKSKKRADIAKVIRPLAESPSVIVNSFPIIWLSKQLPE
ncbi:MAG: hypothetical protein SNJ55_14340 [Chloroherpetonaceae bacterium]